MEGIYTWRLPKEHALGQIRTQSCDGMFGCGGEFRDDGEDVGAVDPGEGQEPNHVVVYGEVLGDDTSFLRAINLTRFCSSLVISQMLIDVFQKELTNQTKDGVEDFVPGAGPQ